MCRLQTFPDSYEIVGGRTAAQRQLGNAVPSLLAETLGREVRRQLLGDSSVSLDPELLPPRRDPLPPPEKVRRVPKKYHKYIGVHAPHPGTGKGTKGPFRARADWLDG
jgi:DNA (cytosine-5)-methyltransferase 1